MSRTRRGRQMGQPPNYDARAVSEPDRKSRFPCRELFRAGEADGKSAINHDRLRREIARSGKTDEARDRGDLIERGQSLHRGSLRASPLKIFVLIAEITRVQARGVGIDVADVNAVDGDAARAELEREITHHAF